MKEIDLWINGIRRPKQAAFEGPAAASLDEDKGGSTAL